jgi:hypothetical protein
MAHGGFGLILCKILDVLQAHTCSLKCGTLVGHLSLRQMRRVTCTSVVANDGEQRIQTSLYCPIWSTL